MCILGRMKAWPLLLVGIGACAEPPRRPPVTYVPLVRAPEPPPLPSSTFAAALGPTEKEASSAGATLPVTPEGPSSDELCFKKTEHGCCEDAPLKSTPQNVKACPGGSLRKIKCKGFGRNCLPSPAADRANARPKAP